MSPVSYTIRRPCLIFLYFISLIVGARGACNVPETIEFAQPRQGALDKDIFLHGTEVLYDCRPGFVRVPGTKNSITCLPDYTWSPPDTFCQRRSCGNPRDIENGEMEATDFLFGSTVTYTCNKGYRITSRRNYRDCLSVGKWSNNVPECEAVICPAPDTPVDGSFNPQKDEYRYLDSITFSCDKDLQVVGASFASCTSDGTWSSAPPTCKAPVTSCENPGDIDHGKMEHKDFSIGSRVTYTCNSGYTLISRVYYRVCQADGTWSGKAPVCKESVCDKIWELQEETRTCTSTSNELIKYLQVHHLYLQIENLKLDIEIKKKELLS